MLTPTALGLTALDPALSVHLEATIAAAGGCTEPWLDGGLRPLLARPGKRLRPALVFAVAACGPETDKVAAINCAASLELMHLSSLIHDDLMDEADTRGGLPTLHKSIGPGGAIVGGDYLLAVGGGLAAEVSAQAAVVWQRTYADLCLGQASETANRYRTDTTTADYLAVVRGKTAALMSAACRLGALCGGMAPAHVEACAEFGEAFGVVFQLVDDLMDVFSTDELWAKPVAQDVPNGVYTACVLAALDLATDDDGGRLRDLLGPAMTAAEVDRVYDHVRRVGIDFAVDLIDRYADRAREALGALPPSLRIATLAELPKRYLRTVVRSKVDPRFDLCVS
ncbi:MAG TPA: polyprenyl synthetase family protein [Pseudonocardiaceae bacterium]|jgi:geranylgeranyl pyrophosphate synthase